jgi:hypothetical protein
MLGHTMLKKIFNWGKQKEPDPPKGTTIYDTLKLQIGELDELNKQRFSPAKARTVKLTTASSGLEELADLIIEASVFISKQAYLPEKWKLRPVLYVERTLEEYLADGDEISHPLDWLTEHRHYILKLAKAFQALDPADSEYYQRKCNFVVEDILELFKASRVCLR